ncbi:MAG TPA: hypothetical protein DHV59_15100 [Oxalobacteraceae bacterium]|nr:hypothetical protein [Oxalobacteraceae bacterium]
MNVNSRKIGFLASIPQASIDLDSDTLAQRCKFNFSYFCKQPAGQSFDQWDAGQLVKLLDKLKEYSVMPLSHWQNQRVGKSGTVLAIYGAFPKKSDFEHPKHVPHQAQWGRFRLEQSVRLIGFTLPQEFHEKMHNCGSRFDCNTFYVVFLDAHHCFYKTGEAK